MPTGDVFMEPNLSLVNLVSSAHNTGRLQIFPSHIWIFSPELGLFVDMFAISSAQQNLACHGKVQFIFHSA